MFILKKKYYLFLENTKELNLNLIKKPNKCILIYRNKKFNESTNDLIKFRKICKSRQIQFYIANDLKLAKICKADGVYLSSYNLKIYKNLKLIGSAHNYKEIKKKINQGCETIILSRLFKTNYKYKKSYFDVTKFNLMTQKFNYNIVPLGGIRNSNLLKLKILAADGFALLSELKKKPAIANRLF